MKVFSRVLLMIGSIVFLVLKKKDKTMREKGIVPLKKGKTQAAYSFKKAIVEEVYVETEVDSDRDGKKDRVYVEVIRPRETNKGLKVPVIYNMSPYNGEDKYPNYHGVDEELYTGGPSSVKKGNYDTYFLARGYAIVNANSIGTIGSDGCPTTGDSQEILAAKAVIDWLNGRGVARNKKNEKVVADWTTGNVGMIGLSYEGTIPNGVATTGVEGLKTIVPIGSISNWYDYYRANGAVIAPGGYQGDDADRLARGVLARENLEICNCLMDEIEKDQDRVTGNYNEFWEERNYVIKAENIQASVLLVHGLNDVNVKRKQFAQWWNVLKEYNVPRKLWLHQGGHIDPQKVDADEWLPTLHRWFDYWLYDIENGIMDDPQVNIQAQDNSWESLQDWPHVDRVKHMLYMNVDEHEIGSLRQENTQADDVSVSVTDDSSILAKELIKDPHVRSPHRLAFLSPVLEEAVRLSGTPSISLRASFDEPVANLSVLLVEYAKNEGNIVTRGWMDPCNVHSIWESEELIPHKPYTFNWEMEPHDYEFSEGSQLGIVVILTDYEFTKRPKVAPTMKVYPSQSTVTLPLVGRVPRSE